MIMRRIIIVLFVFAAAFRSLDAYAGNEQRAGEAGAQQLLLNPWASSAGWASSNMSLTTGIEALFMNVAGTAFVNKLDLTYSYVNHFLGAGINVNNFGVSTKAGEAGVLSAALQSMSFGEIPTTTVSNPDGTGTTFSPKYNVISVAYARQFSNAIYGGATIKVVTERVDDASATGVAIDAGIQYLAGPRDNFRFGVSMQNVGPTMKYSGNGLSFRGYTPDDVFMTFDLPSAEFELPTLIRIGVSNDFQLTEPIHLTVAGTFTSNSFTRDLFSLGAELSLFDIVKLRGGFSYEKGIFDPAQRLTAFTGLAAGATVVIPLDSENGTRACVDYAYRDTNPFGGMHYVGVRLSL